jgi:hypothetical protein|tara:strand:- start:72 stop:236 length:165 start_codon:yes stop_codon:yes gene_type:complete
MAQSGISPPRLPEPPQEINRQYMQDLIRAIQTFITQERSKNVSDEIQATNWFMD